MKNIRIIPKLDIKGPNLVKGVHLEGLRVLGKPEEFAKYYYKMGADELLYMDVVASLYNRNSLLDIVTKTAQEIFIPLTVGGGLRTIEDIRTVLRAGADKVSLNTAATRNPDIIREAANIFGSSTIVIAIEAIKQQDGRYLAYTDNGREHTGLDVFVWAKRVAELGAGEIMIVSVDREGTGTGYDIELTQKVAQSVLIPVIACGGAGQTQHVIDVVSQGRADAVGLASVLHYDFISGPDYAKRHHFQEGNTEFLKRGKISSQFKPVDLFQLKKELVERGINCRLSHFEDDSMQCKETAQK